VINIDIEGFTNIYATSHAHAYHLLCNLIRDIYYIMERVYPEPDRPYGQASLSLIAYHFGDGVVIVPGPTGFELSIVKPLSISIALMKAVTWRGGFAKASISCGEMNDFQGCFPEDIRDKIKHGSYIETSIDLITVLPVMGQGWINSYALSKKASGPILLVDKILRDSIDGSNFDLISEGEDYVQIDWINSRNELITHILDRIEVPELQPYTIRAALKQYLKENESSLGDRWRVSAKKLIDRN